MVSRYDDILADVLRRPGYKAGDTLRLILPFLKAYDATDQKIQEFSAKTLSLIPNSRVTIKYIEQMAAAFIVSTSYEHYIKVLCKALDFPFENTYCTRMSLDNYILLQTEKKQLKKIAQEVARMPTFDMPSGAKSLADLPVSAQETVKRLDKTFWKEVSEMDIGKVFSEVSPIGGLEKAEAVKRIVRNLHLDLTDVVYVGDSITDVDAFRLVRDGGGLTVSFNGNQYAVGNAEVAILSEISIITAVVADVFVRFGKKEVLKLVEKFGRKQLKKSLVAKNLLDVLFNLCPEALPRLEIVTEENMEALIRESSIFRKKVRGETVGRLG